VTPEASARVIKAIAELARLALHATSEAVQVAACKELLDRAIGKAVQPHSGEGGEGPVIVKVITGVPRSTHSLVAGIGDTNAQSPGAFALDEHWKGPNHRPHPSR
jgi:hypothetical protein